MNNKQQFLITVNFYSFGLKYLFTTSIIPYPDWEDNDERWLQYSETDVVKDRFKKWYEETTKSKFGGKIMFIENRDYVLASDIKEGL